MTSDPLERLRGRIDLVRVPFTDRLSRLLLLRERDEDALWIGLAAYERPVASAAVLRHLRPIANGAPLPAAFSARPDRIEIATAAGQFRLAFAGPETLVVQVPAAETGIAFDLPGDRVESHAGMGWAHLPNVGRWFAWHGGAGNIAAVRAPNDERQATVRLAVTADSFRTITLRVSPEIGAPVDSSRPDDAVAAAETRWRGWFDRAPEVSEPYQAMALHAWWILAANQILPTVDPRRAGVVPSKLGYVGIWNWDACFHALGLRHGDLEAAKDQLRIILAHQLPDGMLPDVVHDSGVLASTLDLPPNERGHGLPPGWDLAVPIPLTKPPLLAWAARAIWEIERDLAFLREVYGPIVAAHDWWLRAADPDGDGLYAYDHAYSSGLDDSPLWDSGPPVEAAELNAYLVLQCDELAVMAGAIGRPADAARWREQADALAHRIVAARWDARAGLFISTRNGQPIPVATPFGLMPLLTGRLPARIARRLAATMTDERRFWPRYPVPTVALGEPTFAPNRMWRGPVWLNVNRLLVEGLERAGMRAEAAALRRRTLELATSQPDFREYYNPLTGVPPERAAPMFGWAAAAFLDLAVAERHGALRRENGMQ